MLGYALALGGTVGLTAFATKLHKVLASDAAGGLLGALAATAGELALGLGWALLVAVAVRWLSGRARRAVLVAAHVVTLLLLVASLSEHTFFLATGSVVDFTMLVYAVDHFAMVRRVMASEIGVGTVAGILSVVALAVWPVFFRSGRALWRQAVVPSQRKEFTGWLVAASGLAMCLGVASLPVPDGLEVLHGAALVDLAQGWQQSSGDLSDDDDLGDGSQTPPSEPLVVTRTDKTKPYNVVFVVLESTRAVSTSPYSPGLQTTPFLSKLAAEGTRIDRAYTTIPHTTKALVAIHCGHYPRVGQGFAEATPGALPSDCLAKVLARQGYATAYMQTAESVFERRRDLAKGMGFEKIVAKEELAPAKGFEIVGYFGYEDKAVVQPAVDWAAAQKGPFFLAITTVTTHHDYTLPKNWSRHTFVPDKRVNNYLNTIRYTDEFLRDLITSFQKRGLDKNTLFVVIGDHGEAFGEHGMFQHDASNYEEAVRVPLVLWGAGVPKGKVVLGAYQNVDVMPTVLEVLGLNVMVGKLHGRSLLTAPPHDRLYLSCWNKDRCLSVIDGTRKTIDHFGAKRPEVFDLVADPQEKHSLVPPTGRIPAEIQTRIKDMERWRTEVNARYEKQGMRRKTKFISRQRPEQVGTPVAMKFDDKVELIGYEVENPKVAAGDATWITSTFHVLKKPPPGWKLFVHLHAPDGAMQRADHVPVEGSYPVSEWKAGEYIVDRNWVRLGPGSVSGTYDVFMGFYDPDNGNKRAEPEGKGLPVSLDKRIFLTQLEVTNPDKPRKPPTSASFLPDDLKPLVVHQAPPEKGRIDVRIGDCVQLTDVLLPVQPVRAGAELELRYVMRAQCASPRFSDLFVHLLGPGGRFHNLGQATINRKFTPDRWRAGDKITDFHKFRLPADWPAGETKIGIGLWNPNLSGSRHRLPVKGPGVPTDEGGTRALAATLNVVRP